MIDQTLRATKDWAGNARTFTIAWGLPLTAIIVASLFEVPARTAIWTIALTWMGLACLSNAKRCGRTHCRYTGPYYLLLIIPVMMLGTGLLPPVSYGWWVLGLAILLGGKMIWWLTEVRWGKYTT